MRGSILEDAISLGRNIPTKGHPPKEIFEYLFPEFNMSCLKLGLPTPKAYDQIMKIDEQNVSARAFLVNLKSFVQLLIVITLRLILK